MEVLQTITADPDNLQSMDLGDMDIDMDVDLGPVEDEIAFHSIEENLTSAQHQSNGGGSVQDTTTTPHKIHIRGVDDLTTNDIRSFSTEHYPSSPPVRVEWIDDTSANIVFDDPVAASGALENFTLPSDELAMSALSALQLRRAKTFSTHPASVLQVRTALVTDQKQPRAHETSRFYLMHPEHDPRERRRQGRGVSKGNYRRRGYSHEEHRRRRRRDHEEGFDPSMYDDEPLSTGRESMDMSPDGRDGGSGSSRPGADSYRPARNRSASPNRRDTKDNVRRRQRTPPPSYRARDPHPFPSENTGKELFPSKSTSHTPFEKQEREVFTNKSLAASLKKELFPTKVSTTNHHRRSDAFDAADETADLFANGLSVPFSGSSKGLADRISNASSSTSYGRLKASDTPFSTENQKSTGDGLNILGASNGISIRGSASAAGTIKELCPGKAIGNGGKELFAGKLRSGRRNKAEDMFQ